jgi:acyl-CoA synthetase (AMP-forming)/AMP-acid ligase II
MLQSIRLAFTALARTGLLNPNPLLSIAQLLGCYMRYGASLYTLARWNAGRFPEQLALVEPGRQVTFSQLVQGADALAASLNLSAGQTVGLLGRNSVAYVEILLACGCSGADVLLLNTGFTPEQLLRLAQSRTLNLLICDREFEAKAEGLLAQVQGAVPQVLYTESLDRLGQKEPPPPSHTSGSLILLTSGTTGPAKMIRRRLKPSALLGMLTAILNGLRPKSGDAALLTVPLLHGHGLATLGLCLTMGAPLYLFARARAEELLGCVEAQGIKVLVLVPTILYRLLDHLHTHRFNTQSIRTIVCGSAPLDAGRAKEGLERFGPVLFNLYGTSETGIISLATPQDLQQAPATVGQVLPGVELQVRNTDQSQARPGESGQLWVKSPLTGGTINTGDVGYLDEGRLFLLGRQDDLLICGGEKVFPQVIEETVCHSLSYVSECAATGIPDPEFGQAVHLFVVLKPEHSEVKPEAIAQDLKPLFPRATRPKQIAVLPELPRNLAGKLLRHQLKANQM